MFAIESGSVAFLYNDFCLKSHTFFGYGSYNGYHLSHNNYAMFREV